MIIPLGVVGILQLNVTLVIVGVEMKSLGASSGPIQQMYSLIFS